MCSSACFHTTVLIQGNRLVSHKVYHGLGHDYFSEMKYMACQMDDGKPPVRTSKGQPSNTLRTLTESRYEEILVQQKLQASESSYLSSLCSRLRSETHWAVCMLVHKFTEAHAHCFVSDMNLKLYCGCWPELANEKLCYLASQSYRYQAEATTSSSCHDSVSASSAH
jgi:hypothetical protein